MEKLLLFLREREDGNVKRDPKQVLKWFTECVEIWMRQHARGWKTTWEGSEEDVDD
jgi:hypothetical protein